MRRQLLCAGLALMLAGCASSPPQPASWQLALNSTPDANNGAPLKVRVFVLRSDANFMSSDFYSLQNNASAVLGSDVIDSQQRFLTPQQPQQMLNGSPNPEARYLGVVAEYAAINGKSWRVSVPLPAPSAPHFYQFWRSGPDALNGRVSVTATGLHPAANND